MHYYVWRINGIKKNQQTKSLRKRTHFVTTVNIKRDSFLTVRACRCNILLFIRIYYYYIVSTKCACLLFNLVQLYNPENRTSYRLVRGGIIIRFRVVHHPRTHAGHRPRPVRVPYYIYTRTKIEEH